MPKSIMPIDLTEHELQNFREQLHEKFEHRADSTMDLLDALCSIVRQFASRLEDPGMVHQPTQINTVLSTPNMPWTNELCALVVDSADGNHQFLTPLPAHKNLVIIARSRSNRVFYQRPIPTEKLPEKGDPTWDGERFDLKEPPTWHEPSEVGDTSDRTQRGRKIDVTLTRICY